MHLHKLKVTNFRSLANIEVEFDSLISVIIGPNASGKTTVLEAIRLAKAILAGRTQAEGQQTLHRLGLTSPHIPQRIFSEALTNRGEQPTTVRCSFKVEPSEFQSIEQLIPQLAPRLALQSIGLTFTNPAQSSAFLSSPEGAHALSQATTAIERELTRSKSVGRLELNLTIDYRSGIISGEFPIQQMFYSAVEQQLEPSKTLFSYFPADRALPIGDAQPVVIGLQDTGQQLESYNSQPELKFNRLKNTIFNSIVGSSDGRQSLQEHFKLIFSRVLKGRELGSIGLNQFGGLSIKIIDTESKEVFDVDGLSSGEKGLILTCLIIGRSIAQHGLILLDEPELHLNPAVCRDLLQFLVDEYAVKKNMQAIVCSHSAEILAGAFERTSCSLFHLRGGSSLAKVRQQDQGEIRDALRRLGSSESEALLFKGTISVEGLHDVEILRAGFDQILGRYKLKQLGGRGQLESDIRELQKAEERGDEIGYHFFLFDHDRKPTSLTDSKYVKLRQLQRFCLENYLLDIDIITDLTRDSQYSARPLNNVTDATTMIKETALRQLDYVVALEVFKYLGLENVHFDLTAFNLSSPTEMAANIASQMTVFQQTFASLQPSFSSDFVRLFEAKVAELRALWDDKWREVCDGKRLFSDLRRDGVVQGDLLKLKRRIASEMRIKGTETWNSLDNLLKSLVVA